MIVYLLKEDESVVRFLEPYKTFRPFAISVVTRFEVLAGRKAHQLELHEAEAYLDLFLNLEFDTDIVREAVLFYEHHKKILKFKDLIIAATAKFHRLTLVTADQDFNRFEGVKTLIYKP